jgi:dienelactone hydrolase
MIVPEDRAIFIPQGKDDVFAVLTSPSYAQRGTAVLFVWGAGGVPCFEKNRMLVRLAREAAAAGYHALRFDYPGSGDSSGVFAGHRLDKPAVAEVEAACRWIRDRHLSRIVIVGNCSGARAALAAADRVSGIAALALLSLPTLDHTAKEKKEMKQALERGADPEWSSSSVLDGIGRAVAAKIPLLLVYGRGDALNEEFERAQRGRLGRLLREAGPLASTRVIDGCIHAEPTVKGQEQVVDAVARWLSEL